MKKYIKKCTIIFLIFMIILSSCFIGENSKVLAADNQLECGKKLAAFCRNFMDNYNDQTHYDNSWGQPRADAYLGRKSSRYGGPYYTFDCVGWVSFATKFSLGIGGSTINSPFMAMCPGNGWNGTYNSNCLDVVAGKTPPYQLGQASPISVQNVVQPGDILFTTGINHVLIYVGNGETIGSEGGHATLRKKPLSAFSYSTVLRINKKTADEAIGRATEIFSGQGGITSSDIIGGSGTSYTNMGMGTEAGEFSQITYDFSWLLDSLKQILDWLIGIITYVFRIIILGWTGLIEMLVNNIMSAITNVEASLTIEKLVTNKVPIFDVNFFNFAKAGGEAIEADSVLYTIRENIAMWYFAIRNITIIGLLITLIYIGIRMAISTVSESKAKYKSMLVNWVVSFIIVFCIHYVMIAILQANQIIINTIQTTMGSEEALYDAVRNESYAIQASVGWPATIMYILLVYLLVRFLIVYIKRFLTIGILTFLAPIVAIGYSIDKIKDNKSQSLSNWLRDYTINVIIQSVHCLLYYMFVGLAFNIAGKSIRGVFLALLLVNFILKAEKIFKTIFGIKSKSGSLQDTADTAFKVAASFKVAKNMIGRNTRMLGKVATPITKPAKAFHNKVSENRRHNKIVDIKNALDDAKANNKSSIVIGKRGFEVDALLQQADMSGKDTFEVASDLQDEIDDMKQQERQFAKETIGGTLKDVAGTAGMVLAAPMMVVDEGVGIGMMASAKGLKTRTIKGYKNQYADKKYNRDYKGLKGQARKLAKKQARKGRILRRIDPGLMAAKEIGNIQNMNVSKRNLGAQYNVANRYLNEQIQNEYDKLNGDPNIDTKDLEKAIKNANTLIPEEIIISSVYRVCLDIDIEATREIYEAETGEKLTDGKQTEAINTAAINVIKDMSKNTREFKDLSGGKVIKRSSGEIDKQQLSHMSEISIDKKQFMKNVKQEVKRNLKDDKKTIIVNKRKFKQPSVKVDGKQVVGKLNGKNVKKAFENMTAEERKKIMLKAAINSNNAVEGIDDSLLEQSSNMRLEEVNKVIDNIQKQSEININSDELKNNFKTIMKSRISQITGETTNKITDAEIENVISQMSGNDIINTIAEAGTKNSVVLDTKYDKKEYKTILNLMEKKKYNDYILGQIGYDEQEAEDITKRIKARKEVRKGVRIR